MFKTQSMRRFDAAGGLNQKIQLNQFAIRKQVDVKRLKYQLWDTMEPILSSNSKPKQGQQEEDVEMDDHKVGDLTAAGLL